MKGLGARSALTTRCWATGAAVGCGVPPTPTSAWQPGSVVEHARTVFVPHDAAPGPTTGEVSLRDPESGSPVALADGTGDGSAGTSRVGRLTIDPRAGGLPITHRSGWYGFEQDPDDRSIRWQWTVAAASRSFPNPRSDAVVYLHASSLAAGRGETPEASVHVGYSQLEMRDLLLDSYDVIYVDGAHDAANVLEDAMLTRRLLKEGGIIIFDDYDWPINPGVKLAVDRFVEVYGDEYSLVHRGYQLVLRKGPRP